MIFIRSALFNIWFYGTISLFILAACVMALISKPLASPIARSWSRSNVAMLRLICGIRIEVHGWEWIPPGAALIASQHQSALDTVVWFSLLPRSVYVLKQELVRIPVLGWLLIKLGNIAVDRSGGASALRGLLKDGGAALAAGRQVVIFPEGTRVAAGETGTLHPGVAALASYTGAAVVPVATDSGFCWGRKAFTKRPGVVHVMMRPPLPVGLKRAELLAALQQSWDQGQQAIAQLVDKSVA